MKVRRVWLRGLVFFLFLVSLTFSTAHAQPDLVDLSMWEGKLFSLVETRIGLDFNGRNVVNSQSVLKKLLYICNGDEVNNTSNNNGHVLHGLLYVLEGMGYRFDRFIDLEYLGGTALDFYGNSFAFPMAIMATGGDGQLGGVGDRTVFRLTGKMKRGSLSASFVTIGGIFNEFEFPFNPALTFNEDNFESIRAGGLSYVGALLPDLVAKPIIDCLPKPPKPTGSLPPP